VGEREQYEGADFYCDVALRNPNRLDIVRETENVLAFHHTRPSYETHMVVGPKRHIDSVTALVAADEPLARELAIGGAARVLMNVGDYQESKHLHIHVVSSERRRAF